MKKFLLFLMFALFCIPWAANAQQSLPYSYGFENNNLATDGWTTQNPSGLNASEFGIIGTAAQNGSYGFRFSSYNDRGESTQYLISPELVAPNGVVVQFSYKASSSYTSGETFQVGYSTTDDNISSFTFGSENNATNTSWEQTEELVFPAGTKYVAVYYSANYQYRLYVDDFSFEENLPCAKPENLSVTTDGQTATVTWDGTASNNFIVTVNGTPASGQTSPYTFNVALSTTYNISVTANCGSDGLSSPVSTSFTTPDCIGGHTINYTLNDSYGDGWNGNAIQIIDGCGNIETLTIQTGSTNSGTLVLCGDYYQFVWHTGSFASETSFTLTDNGTALYSNQAGSSLTDGQVLYTIGIQPPVMPTALTAGTPGTNEVQLSWTENGTATTWQICINDDENNLVVANSNPFTLTGLDAVTPYTVKVRSTDGTSVSCWSNAVSFTTDSQCPTPNGLNVTNLMPTSATLNWEGDDDVESYNVRYRTAASSSETTTFSEDFENGIPATWTTIDGDDDGNNWLALSEVSTVYTSYSGTMSDWAHSGNNAATSPSFANSVGCFDSDQWLITPQVNLGGTLKFYAASTYSDLDAFEVLLSTSGTAISDFTTTLQTMHDAPYALNDGTDDWEEVTIDLSSYSGQGYIAIHHVSNCMYFLVIDDFAIYANEPAGEWLPNATGASTSDNSLPITGLTPETTYEFQVQADCGTDGESNWSNIATFTTPDACAVPTDLTAEVTGNTAKLSWTGVQENYNVQYREVDPTVPATIILNIPSDVWGDGSGYQMLIDADATAYGTIIPETGGLTTSGDASEETYAEFEYKLPTDADGSCSTSNILVEGSISIEIPAGTYDWCITNPTPGDRVWIAASNGNVGGRQDDYVFEPGTTYEFTIYVSGTNDAVDVTITDNNEWTLVEGVTNPYRLTNLSAETTYKYKVQGVDCDGNGGTTDWSASATFTTGEELVCEKILVDEANPVWSETFEDDAEAAGYVYDPSNPNLWTGVTPACWEYEMYTSASQNQIGDQLDTVPQVYRSFNTTEGGHYSLRMHFKSLLAMPELDENVDLGKIRLNMYVRQSFWRYKLQIGVLTADGTFYPVAVVNNPDKTKTYFDCGFEAVKDLVGEGRRIAFKNFGSSENDPYAVNYLDDITLTYVDEEPLSCLVSPGTTITFEGLTNMSGATGVEPKCWEVITPDVELTSTTKPQLYRGFNSTEGGHYSLRMMNRCVYAMPEFDEEYPIENLTMTLKLRQPNSLYRLQVGVVDEQGVFTVVKTLKSGTTMEAKTVSFANCPVNGRIAFRNTLVPGTGMSTDYLDYSYNYIDDINFSVTEEAKIDANDESVMDAALEDITIYPNPTTGNLYIDAIGIQKVECYNQMGQLVRVYDNVRNSIDLNNLSEGVYTLRITVPQGVTVRKVVKK